jgi:spermidine synthase
MTTRVFEHHDESYGAFFEITKTLEETESEFQRIAVHETERHGRVMFIDGVCMLTQHTHFVYHEHMTHVPLACVEAPKSVLVVGGGDGGTVTELVKRRDVERIVLAELDERVIDVSRRWFPELTKGLEDPRVEIRIGDGAAYVADNPGAFDVVIIDSTDICEEAHEDTSAASPLATDQFQHDLRAALRPGGVATQILGSPIFYRRSLLEQLRRLQGLWPRFELMLMPCPFYISGDWAAGMFSVDNDLKPTRFPLPDDALEYINADTARGCLALPNYIKRAIGRD